MKKNVIVITTICMLLLSSFMITPVFSDSNEPSNRTTHYVSGKENKQQPELTLTNEYTSSEAIMKAGGEGTSQRGETIVWDNGMDYVGLLAAQWDEDISFDAYPADDFHFDEDTIVNDVHWIGGYWNINYTQGDFDWNITFYYDQGDGEAPGAVYAGPYTYTQDQCNPKLLEDTGDTIYYELSVDLPTDLTFTGCETYWASIWGVGAYPPQSGWGNNETITMHQAVFKSEYFVIPDWTNTSEIFGTAYDMCFQLTFTEPCEPSIDVEKYVWDPVLGDWVDADDTDSAVDLPVDSTAEFKIAIHNNGTCCNLTEILVGDFMEKNLTFETAEPYPDHVEYIEPYWYLVWLFPEPLKPCEWINITVNATVVGAEYNTSYNYVYVNGSCEETGGYVEDEDYAYVHVHAIPENNPPYEPSKPNPDDDATGVDINADLSWTGGDPDPGDTVTYDVYFLKDNNPMPSSMPLVSDNQSETFYDPGELEFDSKYFWQIVAWDNHGAKNESPVWNFTTRTQYIPDPPTDFTATTINRTCINLSWINAGDNKTYIEWNNIETWNREEGTEIYNDTGTSYSHTDLEFNTQYFYQAWSYNETDNTYSTIYASDNATTDANQPPYMPSAPNPENGTTDVDVNADLSWAGGDPDGDSVTYDVYFGNTSSPPKVENNQSTTTYEPGTLEFNTTYYWKIVAWDNYNESNTSSIWSFTTEETPNQLPTVNIIQPEKAVYIFNRKVLPRLIRFRLPLIIGDITIIVNATDEDSGIEKVEFLIDGKLKATDTSAPYTYYWTRDRFRLIHLRIIKVIAHDKDGATAKYQMLVRRYL